MALSRWVRWAALLGILAALAALALLPSGPASETLVALAGPEKVELTLADLQALPAIEREGSYQNSYGNWSTPARYRGVPLDVLVGGRFPKLWPGEITVVGADGYRITFTVDRLEDADYPVVLAYAKDGLTPPAWEEGPRIAVLPEGGRVSNEDYEAESAGAYWVRNVVRLELEW
ncbi:MAG: hypothetical protein R6U88_06025 [Candidatus Bipolaricaulota bacterium]